MGQYHIIVNLDKKEFLHPHHLGDGLKLMEFGSGGNTMLGLALLLATSNGHGGGDVPTQNTKIPGRWAGDRIVVVGDYDDFSKFKGLHLKCVDPTDDRNNLSFFGDGEYYDISWETMDALLDDAYVREDVAKNIFYKQMWQMYRPDKKPFPKKKKEGGGKK